ncbi:hypothetical protein MTQ16_09770 [Corynebacterium bovis]|uniref:hypothetical protein n=1 Tax=Corynebacterium bovis TaxID=36808 RepID=UPI003138799E
MRQRIRRAQQPAETGSPRSCQTRTSKKTWQERRDGDQQPRGGSLDRVDDTGGDEVVDDDVDVGDDVRAGDLLHHRAGEPDRVAHQSGHTPTGGHGLGHEVRRITPEHIRRRRQTIRSPLPTGALPRDKRIISTGGPVGHLRRSQGVSNRLLSIRERSAADNVTDRLRRGLDRLVDVIAGRRLKRAHDIPDHRRVGQSLGHPFGDRIRSLLIPTGSQRAGHRTRSKPRASLIHHRVRATGSNRLSPGGEEL